MFRSYRFDNAHSMGGCPVQNFSDQRCLISGYRNFEVFGCSGTEKKMDIWNTVRRSGCHNSGEVYDLRGRNVAIFEKIVDFFPCFRNRHDDYVFIGRSCGNYTPLYEILGVLSVESVNGCHIFKRLMSEDKNRKIPHFQRDVSVDKIVYASSYRQYQKVPLFL